MPASSSCVAFAADIPSLANSLTLRDHKSDTDSGSMAPVQRYYAKMATVRTDTWALKRGPVTVAGAHRRACRAVVADRRPACRAVARRDASSVGCRADRRAGWVPRPRGIAVRHRPDDRPSIGFENGKPAGPHAIGGRPGRSCDCRRPACRRTVDQPENTVIATSTHQGRDHADTHGPDDRARRDHRRRSAARPRPATR